MFCDTVGALCCIAMCAGCHDRIVIVSVENWTDSAPSLYVRTSLGESLASPINLSTEQAKFVVHLPSNQDGWFTINAATKAIDDSKVSVATASILINSQTTFPAEAKLKLCKLANPTKSDWVPYCNPSVANVDKIFGIDPNNIYAISNQVLPVQADEILHWNGSAWQKLDDPTIPRIFYVLRVWGSSAEDIWVAGFDSRMMHYDGHRWSTVSPATEAGISKAEQFTGLWGTSSSEIWAITNSGIGMHWNGQRWSHAVHVSLPQGSWVWEDKTGTAWGVGGTPESAGKVYSWDRASMHPVIDLKAETGYAEKLNHITGIDDKNIVVSANNGTIFMLSNGAWKRKNTGIATHYTSGIMISDTSAWFVGDNGAITHWDGNHFTDSNSGTTDPLWSIWGPSSHDLWAVGRGATSGVASRIFRYIP